MNKLESLITDTDFIALELCEFQWNYLKFIPLEHEKIWKRLYEFAIILWKDICRDAFYCHCTESCATVMNT